MYKKTIWLAAMLISTLSCLGQNVTPDKVVGNWIKSSSDATVTFILTSDGEYEVEFTGDDEADVLGKYKISENQITFNDEGGDYSSTEPGVYEFKADGGTLTFTEVDDPVDGRRMVVEGTWSKADAP